MAVEGAVIARAMGGTLAVLVVVICSHLVLAFQQRCRVILHP
ncbi:hypothetical protein Q644_23390 [Brucella intermedia 229E]|uniref:Uncharacterized protein n=1 Tax=Brucella intermedia 229E TaxID=1337887 RepID=U4V7X5_9HYPH|nr:hypothetical protein Q644_23390 [Brucella intermedia 229E]